MVILKVGLISSASDLDFIAHIRGSASPRNLDGIFLDLSRLLAPSARNAHGRIAKPTRTAFVAHKTPWAASEKSRKMSAVAVDLRQFGQFLDRQHAAVTCVCCHEIASQDGKLIDFGDPACLMLDFVERYSSRMLVHFRMVALFFANKFKTALVTGQDDPAGAQLPWLPDDMLTAEPLLSSLELQEEALLRAVRSGEDSASSWHKYASSFDPTVRRLFEVVDRVKTELQRRRPLSSLEDTWGWPYLDCAGHIMSHAPYVGICECAASSKMHTASLDKSGSLTSLSLSISDSGGHGTKPSGLNCVGEDKSTMFLSYSGPLPIHPRWYELPLGICKSGDLSQAPTRGEEHDARDAVRLYKDTLREDALEFGDVEAAVRLPTKHERNVAERVAAVEAGDVEKVARIDARENERCKWKAYHRSVRKARANASKANKIAKDSHTS